MFRFPDSRAMLRVIAVSLLIAGGCDLSRPNPPAGQTTASSAPATTESVTDETPTQSTPDSAAPTPSPEVATTQAETPPRPATITVKLSAGTALAQTLATGTAMGFSVDYRFVKGSPDASSQYKWIIERARGERFEQTVQLRDSDTLQMFVPWKPEDGPFKTHLESVDPDGSSQAISASVALR